MRYFVKSAPKLPYYLKLRKTYGFCSLRLGLLVGALTLGTSSFSGSLWLQEARVGAWKALTASASLTDSYCTGLSALVEGPLDSGILTAPS